MRDPTSRERYNFFYKNGVPRWRGTGYLYSRFRPGLGSVLVVLTLIASGMQHIAAKISYHQEKKRIAQFITDARSQMIHDAPKGRAPTLGRTYIAVGQRNMRCDVKDDNYIVVYPDERSGEPVHLNTEWVAEPTWRDIFVVKHAQRLFNKVTGKKEEIEEEYEEVEEDAEQEVASTNSPTTKSPKKTLRKRGTGEKVNVVAAKVGGKRRGNKGAAPTVI